MKKIFKRTLAVFLAALMAFGAAPIAGFVGIELPKINGLEKLSESVSGFFGGFVLKAEAATEYTEGYYTYTVDYNGNARIEDVDTSISGSITIPSTLGGYPVTCICSTAFEECISITSVTIPDSVTSIGWSAFEECNGLTSITIPNSVTSIGDSAFYGCTGLTSVTIGNGVKSIEYDLFRGCTGLTSVSIPDSVILIDDNAFDDCTGLTSITIPDSVTIIGDFAFYGCTGLASVSIPDSVTSIGQSAFYGCTGLAIVSIPDSVTSIGRSAFAECNGLTSITIPNSVTSIGDSAFYGCTGLTSVTIGNSVKNIGGEAFSGCYKLTRITIPNSVTSIGDSAFEKCTGLTSITIPYGVTSIGDYAFKECRGLTSITIPYGVTSIGNGTFSGCYKLTGITLPDSLTSVGNYAFCGCTGLTSITIPDSVTIIGDHAFSGCSGLTNVTIGNGVKSIGDSAFYRCSGLTSATLGKSVKSIGDSAFYECTGLTSISVDNANRFYSNDKYGALFDKNKTMLIQYPAKNENESYDIPESVTKICSGAFIGCKSIRNVNIPDSVTEIESGVFRETYFSNMEYWEDPEALYIDNHLIWAVPNSSTYTVKEGTKTIAANAFLTSVSTIIIPDSVVSIGNRAFYNCEFLTSITIGNGVKKIGEDAFSNCKLLETINGAVNVEHLGEGVFNENCPYISDESNYVDGVMYVGKHLYKAKTSISGSYQIKAGTTEIGKGAFEKCTKITDVTIPDSVTSIGDRAFRWCESLASITIGNGITSIGKSAFMKCAKLTSIIIPDGVTTIGEYTFDECSSLTSISIPDGVTYIGDRAFARCEKLTSISIPDGVTYIGEHAFQMCSALTSIVIPDGVTTIGEYTFDECSSLTSITIPNSVTSIGDRAFSVCTSLASVTIPNSVTSIDGYAFDGCSGLSSVIIPDSVISIGRYAFGNCTELHIPTNVNVLERGVISSAGYICSNTEDCFAKVYADAYGIEFRVCNHSFDDLSKILLSSSYPTKDATKISSDDDLVIKFNQPIEDSFYFETAEKEISIRNYYTDEPIVVINDKNFLNYWNLIDFSGNTITISGVLSKICPGEKYYITISPGIISAKGDYSKTFAGITDKDEWTFTYSDESEKKGYNFEVYSSRSSFNMNKGETLNAKVVLTLNGEKCIQEGISYTIGDSSIAKVKSMSHDESGTTFTIEALSYGVTTLDIIYKAGSLRESYIIKVADEKTVYYLEDIKGRNQDKNPFYTCGLYIDDLNYTESADGRANVAFDVYNYSHCYGAVEVHDASGNLVNSEMIAMFNGEYNTDFVSYGTYVYKVGRDVFNGDFIDNDVYKTDVKTQKTSISVSIPKGGYIVITKNVSESMPCLLYNITLLAIEGASTTAKIIHDGKFKSSDALIKGIVDATAQKISWKDLAVSLSSSVVKKIVNNFISAGNELNIMSMLNATEGVYDELDEFYESFDIDWADIVISTAKKMLPNTTIQFVTGFTLGKLGGDIADLFFSAVGIGKYCEILMEVTDYTDVSGTYIYNSQKGNTRYSNKVIAKSDAIPDNVVFHSVLIKSGNIGDVYNGYTESYEEAELYDISLIRNGNKIQPNGKVQVHIPIPSGWDASKISVHHETSYREYEKLDVTIEDGYIIFYTDSFSNFIIVNGDVKLTTPEVVVRTPSTTTIKYGDSIVLHADMNEALPSGWRVEWTADNDNFNYSANGETCKIDPNKSGSTTFTATIYDAQGNAVSKDEQTMTSKAGFFDKIIAFFKGLFGLSKVYDK